jgi:hypothetical protein
MPSQIFTSSGTFPWPDGTTMLVAEGVGGGGAGGGVTGNPAVGGGGKGGGYAKKTITKGGESSLTITIGAGGASSTTVVGNGAPTEVVQNGSTVLRATGGNGAACSITTLTGAAGTTENGTAVGDTTFAGGNGAAGPGSTTISGAGGGAAGPSGAGGNATTGTGGARGAGMWRDGSLNRNSAGANGVAVRNAGATGANYGAGGSGGNTNQATDRASGAGAPGIVLLTWFEDADFVHDNCIDADDTDLTAHTGEKGATWALPSYLTVSSPKITTLRARTVNDVAFAYASGVPPSANYTIEALFRQISDESANTGIVARLDTSADNHYIIRYSSDANQWQLRKTVAATPTSLGTFNESLSNGNERTVKFVLSGSSLEVFIDGVSRITATDSDISAAGRVGMRHTALASGATTGIHIDWIRAYTLPEAFKPSGFQFLYQSFLAQ